MNGIKVLKDKDLGVYAGSPLLEWIEISWLFTARLVLESVWDKLAHEYERSEQIEVMSILEYKTCFTKFKDMILTLSKKICVSDGSL
jgi:hypothetical protein